nr:hypothetical protein [uncultured Rhodoferax sp.]
MQKTIASLCISLALSVAGASAFASDEVNFKEGELFFKCKVSGSTTCVIKGIPAYGSKEKAADEHAASPYSPMGLTSQKIPNFLANNLSLNAKGLGTLGTWVKDWRFHQRDSNAVLTMDYEELMRMIDPSARVTRLTYANDSLFVHFVRGAKK